MPLRLIFALLSLLTFSSLPAKADRRLYDSRTVIKTCPGITEYNNSDNSFVGHGIFLDIQFGCRVGDPLPSEYTATFLNDDGSPGEKFNCSTTVSSFEGWRPYNCTVDISTIPEQPKSPVYCNLSEKNCKHYETLFISQYGIIHYIHHYRENCDGSDYPSVVSQMDYKRLFGDEDLRPCRYFETTVRLQDGDAEYFARTQPGFAEVQRCLKTGYIDNSFGTHGAFGIDNFGSIDGKPLGPFKAPLALSQTRSSEPNTLYFWGLSGSQESLKGLSFLNPDGTTRVPCDIRAIWVAVVNSTFGEHSQVIHLAEFPEHQWISSVKLLKVYPDGRSILVKINYLITSKTYEFNSDGSLKEIL